MQIINRHIEKVVISSILLILLVMVALSMFIDMSNEMAQIGRQSYSFFEALLVVLLQIPANIYQLFPIVGFLGCLVGLGRLASYSELTIMRASGVSINRIAWMVAKSAIVMVVLMTLVGEVAAPILQNKAERIKQTALRQHSDQVSLSNVWFHNDNRFIHIGQVLSRRLIKNIAIYQFNNQQQLQKVITSQKGRSVTKRQWVLDKANVTQLTKNKITSNLRSGYPVSLYIRPGMLQYDRNEVKQASMLTLLKNIRYRQHTGLTTHIYVFSFWSRLLQPLSSILMICLAVPFVFGSLRDSSMTVRLITGLFIGFAFYMMNRLFGPVAMMYDFPEVWAAVFPLIFILIGYLYLLRRAS
jgi:lipopolysaccharide export system permease protein